MTLDWRVVLFEAINFLVLVAILRRFLFAPIRDVVRRRKEETDRRDQEVSAREAATAALRAELEAKLSALAAEAERTRHEARVAAAEEADTVLAAARREREALLRHAAEEASAARARTLRTLRDEVLSVAVEAAGRIVTGVGQPALVESFARLGAERLRAAGLAPGTAVQVAVSPDGDLEQVRHALAAVLGEGTLTLCHDPTVRGGVRLVARDLEVDASAGASLADWLLELEPAERQERVA